MIIKDFANTKEDFKIEYFPDLECYKTDIRTIAEIETYYTYENYQSHNQNESGLFNKLYKWAQVYNLNYKYDLIKNLKLDGTKILDYGCGVGDFVKKMQSKSWEALAFEPNEDAKKILIKNNIDHIENIGKIKNDSLDIITLWHVLEHIENPLERINELKQKLKTGGYLIIAVPNYNSYDAKFYKNTWAAYDVPRHIYHFQRKSFVNLAEKTNLKLRQTEPLCLDSFYVSILSENYKKNKNLIRAIIIGLISNIKSIFTKEYSSVIYFLQKTT